MATIRNTIETKHTSRGSNKTVGDLNKVDKAQQAAVKGTDQSTRAQQNVGKATANASRQFGAQASGLGGLVASYAGAAATIFAVQQAFSALARAAAAEQTLRGVQTLASAIGESGDVVIAKIREITNGQLNLIDVAENVNIALSAGFNTEQIELLSEVSLKASRALGRSLNDAFNRLVRGTAKLEPELLDELGIFTRLDPAVEKYASSVNKSASQLTAFERRQAFVNSAIEEGLQKFATINTTIPTAAESIEKFGANIIDLGTRFGILLANFLTPLTDFISGDVSNTFAVFGLLARTVFGKALETLEVGVTGLTTRLSELTERGVNRLAARSVASAKSIETLGDTVEDLNLRLARGPERARFRELVNLGKQGELTAAQVSQLNTATQQQIALTGREVTTLQEKIKRQEVAGRNTADLRARVATLQAEEAKLQTTLKATTAAMNSQGRAAILLQKGLTRVTTAIAFLGRTLVRGLALLGNLVAAFSILTLVGNAVLDFFGAKDVVQRFFVDVGRGIKEFFGFTEEVKLAQQGVQGITSAFVEASVKAGELDSQLRETRTVLGLFTLDPVDIGIEEFARAIGETFNDLEERIRSIQRNSQRVARRTGRPEESREDLTERLLNEIRPDAIERFGEQAGERFIEGVRRNLELAPIRVLLQRIANVSGQTSAQIARDFSVNANGAILELTSTVKELEGITFSISPEGTEELNRSTTQLILGFQQAQNLQKGLNEGRISAEGIAQKQLAVEKFINRARELGIELVGRERIIFEESLGIVEKRLQLTREEAEAHKAIELTTTNVRKTFSAQISAADKLTGVVSLQGNLAENNAEAERNRLVLLDEILQATENINGTEGRNQKLLELRNSSIKVLVGSYINVANQLDKIDRQLESILMKEIQRSTGSQFTAQIDNLRAQTRELQLQIRSRRELSDLQQEEVNIANRIAVARQERENINITQPSILSDIQQADIEVTISKESLAAFERNITRQVQAIKAETQARLQNLNRQEALLNEESADRAELARLAVRQRELEQRNEATRIRADAASRAFQLDRLNDQLTIIDRQAEIFAEHPKALRSAFVNHAREIRRALDGADFNEELVQRELDDNFGRSIDNNISIRTAEVEETLVKARLQLANTTRNLIELTEERAFADIKLINAESELTQDKIDAQLRVIAQQKILATEEEKLKLAQLEQELSLGRKIIEARDSVIEDLTEINDGLATIFAELAKQASELQITSQLSDLNNQTRELNLQIRARNELSNLLQQEVDLANRIVMTRRESQSLIGTPETRNRSEVDLTTTAADAPSDRGVQTTGTVAPVEFSNNRLVELQNALELATSTRSNLVSDFERTQIEIDISRESLAIFRNDIQSQIQAIKEETTARIQNLNRQEAILNEESADRASLAQLSIRQRELEQQSEVARIRADAATRTTQLDGLREQLSIVETQAEIFTTHSRELRSAFIDHIVEIRRALAQDNNFDANATRSDIETNFVDPTRIAITERIAQAESNLNKSREQLASNTETQIGLANDQARADIRLLRSEQTLAQDRIAAQLRILDAQRQFASEEELLKISQLEKELRLEERRVDSRIRILEEQNNVLINFANSVVGNLKETFETGFKDILNVVFTGSGDIRDAFRNLMNNILLSVIDTVNQQLIVKPISGFLTSGLGSLIGGALGGGPAAPPVPVGDGPGSPIFRAAGGNVPRFANGGLRDRVPAMLEPGEFVLRRQAVNNIGLPAARQINSGVPGAGYSVPQPVININNQSSQPVEADQPEIKFDPERMVVDVVIRDLRNNGPIRRDIRGIR